MAGPDFSQNFGQRAERDDSDPAVPPNVLLWSLLAGGVTATAMWLAALQPPVRAGVATFDLERDLAKAQVHTGAASHASKCPWSAVQQRFVCGSEPWAFVGPYGGHTAGKARRCTWVHPLGGSVPVVLTWPKLVLGAHLSASVGLVDEAGGGTPLQLKVFVAGTALATVESSDARQLTEVDVAVPSGPREGELRIEAQARDHSLRMACIDVRMRGERLTAVAIDATLPVGTP